MYNSETTGFLRPHYLIFSTILKNTEMDKFSSEKRSQIMAKVKGKDTKPELVVRRLVSAMGYRYRLHRKDLPGKPDLAFIGRKKVVFVNGCFWHQHPNCKRAVRPTTNQSFWNGKLNRNIERDRQALADYARMGWEVLTIWQCEIKNLDDLQSRLADFLGPPPNHKSRSSTSH